MRDIKFRAWDEEYKLMINNCGVLNGNAYDIRLMKARMIPLKTTAFEAIESIIHERIILMQYTGLKDKNGKEIYEGDVLLSHFDRNDIPNNYQIVEWNENNACFIARDKKQFRLEGKLHPTWWSTNCEIIGNKYENHELLEENKC